MKTTTKAGTERFQDGAQKYAAYLHTPEGRLRSDLCFANLEEHLPLQSRPSMRALDLGCGTGATAIRLGRLGVHVTLLDSSRPMLDLAQDAIREAGLTERADLRHGDAAQLESLFPARSFDLILCHNVLEYCDDPALVLRAVAAAMRDSSAILSILVRNQAGEVLKSALQSGDLKAADKSLTAEWAHESLYGGPVRLFTPRSLRELLTKASLKPFAERGVRALSDYLPTQISRTTDYQQIFELERKLSVRVDYSAIARYIHWLAHGEALAVENGA